MGDSVTKAKLIVEGRKDPIEVEFNPTEYSLSNSIRYSKKKIHGKNHPIGQYTGGNGTTLKVAFLFDTYQAPTLNNPAAGGTDVTEYTKKITDLTLINGKLHRVPKVIFSWGTINFTGVITSVEEHYTMFLPSGMPVRAKLDVCFQSVEDISTSQEASPKESPDRTKVVTVSQGDSLWSIAAQEYDNPEQWKVIAKENGILNPLDINPGQILKLPPL